MKKPEIILINQTSFDSTKLKEIAGALLEGQVYPSFYLIIDKKEHDGITLTNLDKPTMIITPYDLHHFARVFVHELVHLQQHQKGYANETEAYKERREVVITE